MSNMSYPWVIGVLVSRIYSWNSYFIVLASTKTITKKLESDKFKNFENFGIVFGWKLKMKLLMESTETVSEWQRNQLIYIWYRKRKQEWQNVRHFPYRSIRSGASFFALPWANISRCSSSLGISENFVEPTLTWASFSNWSSSFKLSSSLSCSFIAERNRSMKSFLLGPLFPFLNQR